LRTLKRRKTLWLNRALLSKDQPLVQDDRGYECPLLGAKRKCQGPVTNSAFDPKLMCYGGGATPPLGKPPKTCVRCSTQYASLRSRKSNTQGCGR
jgi:hypothetical protein